MFNLHVLGFVAPRRVNLNLHQIIYLNIKYVGCSSLHAVTSTINVQFASKINYCVYDDNLHVCINLCKIRSVLLLDMLYGLCQLLGIGAPRRVNLNLHQIIYLNIKSVGCSSLHSVTSTINVQFASKINYCVYDDNLHVCTNLCKIRSVPLLDMLYGLCQLLGIDSPSWRTLTSTINVQFAKYKNNCFQVCDFVCAHKLM